MSAAEAAAKGLSNSLALKNALAPGLHVMILGGVRKQSRKSKQKTGTAQWCCSLQFLDFVLRARLGF